MAGLPINEKIEPFAGEKWLYNNVLKPIGGAVMGMGEQMRVKQEVGLF